MRRIIYFSVLAAFFLTVVATCQETQVYPVIPNLEFKEYYTKKDSLDQFSNKSKYLELTFYVIDGDGDIGFSNPIISPEGIELNNDLFSKIFYKENGEFYEYKLYKVTDKLIDSLISLEYPKELTDSLIIMHSIDKESAHRNTESIDNLFSQFLSENDYTIYHNFLIEFSKNTDNLNFVMPYIEQSEGQNKTLKADIKLEMTFIEMGEEMPHDTIIYETYIYDRMSNKSNIVTTPEIIFK